MSQDIILNFMNGDSYNYTIQSNNDTIETLLNNTILKANKTPYIHSIFKTGEDDKLTHDTLLHTLNNTETQNNTESQNNTEPLILFGLSENITEDIFREYQTLYRELLYNNYCRDFLDLQNAKYMLIKSNYIASSSICKIVDIYPIRYLHNMKTLKLENCKIKNLSSLVYCNNLTEITISGHSNIEDISYLKNIKVLNIYYCNILNIYSSCVLSNLHCLNISECYNIEQLSLLKSTPNITILSIRKCNPLTDISDISNLKKLYSFEIINCNNVKDISCLKGLLHLNNVSITRCGIIDISVFEHTPHILGLILKSIEIDDISSLKYLTRLIELRLQYCRDITDISVLESLKNLKNLYFYRCKNVKNMYIIDKLSKRIEVKRF